MVKQQEPSETRLKLYAYAPSFDECTNHNAKFPSLSVKKVAKEAYNCGASVDLRPHAENRGAGFFSTRTPVAYTPFRWCVDIDGSLFIDYFHGKNSGACLGISVIYDPESKLVKTATKRDFSRVVFNSKKEVKQGKADEDVPIVKFGDYEYIWYNKEDCESGENPLMDLVILDMPECAKPFEPIEKYDDYGLATEQHEQYNRIALQGTSEEERKLLVLMSFTRDDGYDKATPVYTKEQEEIIDRVKTSFEPQN